MTSFDERAREWDTPERIERADMLARLIRAAVPLPPGAAVIDLGAGTGLLGYALVDGGGVERLVLAEPSAGMREVAAGKAQERGLSGVEVIDLDLAGDVPAAEPFDLAASMLVLHHVHDTRQVLASVHGLVRAGGAIALADLDAEDGTFHSADAEGIHHHGFEREHIEALARGAGFTDVRTLDGPIVEHEDRGYPMFLLVARRP
jgi:2-polyprenyl-3-methyl-5-hydroxy-6-metoxy-1,4-benzoquinol methylase